MNREEELKKLFGNKDSTDLILLKNLVDNLVFLEKQLQIVRELPFIKFSKEDPMKQRVTPAYKMYKDLSQTYMNALKIINGVLGIESDEVVSPLRKYMNARLKEIDDKQSMVSDSV